MDRAMNWKLNYKGEAEYHRHDPEKIQEMSEHTLLAFGVALHSRYAQVREMLCMLASVQELHRRDRETLRLMKHVNWDSKGCCMTITMRCAMPFGWFEQDADDLAELFRRHGGPHNITIEADDMHIETEGREDFELGEGGE